MSANLTQELSSRPAKILIADDQPVNIKILTSLLQGNQYELLVAENGLQTVQMIAEHLPDLVLLDVMMPEMDGFQVCYKIKHNPQMRHIPIIMVTALDQTEDYVKGIECGADDFMTKPINPNILLARVNGYLKTKKLYDENLRLDQLKQDLTRMIIHDLSNPITGIMGHLQLLSYEENLPEKIADRLDSLTSATRHVMKLIQNMRGIDKLESGSLTLKRSQIDAPSLTSKIMDIITPILLEKNLQIETDGPEDLCFYWDVDLMSRVLQNLLDNAVSFAPEGTSLCIRWEQMDDQFDCLSVSNHGPTIPAEKQTQVFNKFAQIEAPHTRRERGSGLGLAFCKLAVEAHDGELSVTSPVPDWNEGACFSIKIPRQEP